MKLQVQIENPFLCPPGYHRAICTGVWSLPKSESEQESIRLAFDVFPENAYPGHQYKAGKRYPKSLAYGSQFRGDVESWIGSKELTVEGEFETDTLVGRPARLLIKHRHNAGWEHPYVYIAYIGPIEEKRAPATVQGRPSERSPEVAMDRQ